MYTASNLALAALEQIVHAGRRFWDLDFAAIAIDIDDAVRVDRVEQHALPPDWQHQPSHPTLREIGDTWVTNRASVAMLVPSAVIPLEFNALLNPAHPDFASITVSDAVEFKFDRRLAALVSV